MSIVGCAQDAYLIPHFFLKNQTLSAFDLINPRSLRHQRCSCIHDLQVIISWHTPGQNSLCKTPQKLRKNEVSITFHWQIGHLKFRDISAAMLRLLGSGWLTLLGWKLSVRLALLGESSVHPQLLKVVSAAPELGHRVKRQVVPFQNHASFTYKNLWKPNICLSKIHRNDYIKISTICIQTYRETKKKYIWFL